MRARWRVVLAAVLAAAALAWFLFAPPDPEKILAGLEDAPAPVLSPEQERQTFRLPPGFRAELVASEPLVVDPVAMDWDEEGRLYVAEMRGFMPNVDGEGEDAPVGRIVLLEDQDGDGRMDRSDIFLDGLVLPRAVAALPEGILIAAPPDLLLCRDEDDDRRCDAPIRLGPYASTGGNPEHMENGLLVGLDGWLYNAKSDRRIRLANETMQVGASTFRGQFGIAQDDEGRLFYNHNSGFLYGDVFPGEYTLRQPGTAAVVAKPGLNVNLAEGAEVFGVRTAAGLNRAYMSGSLRADGRQLAPTAVSGLTIQRGDQFGDAFAGDAFVPEASGSAVAHFRILRREAVFSAEHVLYADPDFGQREFLASTDERFRPVDADFGPDGALWIIDMYRGVIQHAEFVSDHLREYIERQRLEPPGATGRIWRIVREDRPVDYAPPELKTLEQQLAGLSHPNGWVRDRAQRRLIAEFSPEAASRLREGAGFSPLGQRHGLRVLAASGALDAETWQHALASDAPETRSLALRLGETQAAAGASSMARRIEALLDDPDAGVRLQAIHSLGELPADQRPAERLADLGRDGDPLIQQAAISSLAGVEIATLDAEISRARAGGTVVPGWVTQLAAATLRSAAEISPDALSDLLDRVEAAGDENLREALIAGISEGQMRLGSRRRVLPERHPLFGPAGSPPQSDLVTIRPHFTWPGDPNPGGARALNAEESALRTRGRALYGEVCAACHGEEGQGRSGMAPSLQGSPRIRNSDDWLVGIVLHGLAEPSHGWGSPMPGHGQNPALNDEAIAGLATHLRRSWGHAEDPVTPDRVAAIRASLAERSRPFTLAELRALPTRHRLDRFEGSYGVPVLSFELVVLREEDELTVGLRKGGRETLKELADGVFTSPTVTLHFEADADGAITGAQGLSGDQRFPLSRKEE